MSQNQDANTPSAPPEEPPPSYNELNERSSPASPRAPSPNLTHHPSHLPPQLLAPPPTHVHLRYSPQSSPRHSPFPSPRHSPFPSPRHSPLPSPQHSPRSSQAYLSPPILQQPVSRSSLSTVTVSDSWCQGTEREWNSHLWDCLKEMHSCMCVCLCGWCQLCITSRRMGEGSYMPCCVPPAAALAILRCKLRSKENIQGSVLEDYCVSIWCCPCTLCQLTRELDKVNVRGDAMDIIVARRRY